MEQLIVQHFPLLADKNLLSQIAQSSQIKTIEAGSTLVQKNTYIKAIPLVITGLIKVFREDDDGHEVLLYYIKSGESCAMSLSSCLNGEKSKIKAIVEEQSEIVILPAHLMDEWFKVYPAWKKFVLEIYNRRFEELLMTIDAVAFQNIESRLMKYLSDKASLKNNKEIKSTHQEIAQELSTSREVISRVLKNLEKQKLIALGRNHIQILS